MASNPVTCVAYESADGEDGGACHCGHSVEEHPNGGPCDTCAEGADGE